MANCAICDKTVATHQYVQLKAGDDKRFVCLEHESAEVEAALPETVDVLYNPPTKWYRDRDGKVQMISEPPAVRRLGMPRAAAVAEYEVAKQLAVGGGEQRRPV